MLKRDDIILSSTVITPELVSNVLADGFFMMESYKYLYECISYPVSPLELLRDCSYVENIKKNYNFLAENIENVDNFGRFKCEYLDKDIKEICDYCQKWINYNFPLIYTLKGLSKRHDEDEEKYILLISIYRKLTFYMFVTLCAHKNVIDLNELEKIIGLEISKHVIDFRGECITIEKTMVFYEIMFKEKTDKIMHKLIDCTDNSNVLFRIYNEWKKQNVLETSIVRTL